MLVPPHGVGAGGDVQLPWLMIAESALWFMKDQVVLIPLESISGGLCWWQSPAAARGGAQHPQTP